MHAVLRIVPLVMLTLFPAACGGGALAGVDGCTGGIVLDPRSFHLVVGGDYEYANVTDNSPDGSGTMSETDTCRGIARIDFGNLSYGFARVDVTPLATGACTMTISDGPNCIDTSVTVAPAPDSSSGIRRGVSPAV